MPCKYTKALPYRVPTNTREALSFLADIMKIPRVLVQKGDGHLLCIMSGVVLHRHLPPHQKFELGKMLASLKTVSPQLFMMLQTKILDTTINPEWGVWSMSNEELTHGHEAVEKWLSWLGMLNIPSGVAGVAGRLFQLFRKYRKKESIAWGAETPALAAILMFSGMVESLGDLDHRYEVEISRRSTMLNSIYYQQVH